MGLPAPPSPVEFTRRVLLRRAFFRCALSEVIKESSLPPASRTVPRSASYSAPLTTTGRNIAPEDGQGASDSSVENDPPLCLPSSSSVSPWCHHRADVRLTNFKIRMKKKKVVLDAPTGLSGSSSAGGSHSDLDRLPRKTCSSPASGDGVRGDEGEGRARHKDGLASPDFQGQEVENDADMTIGADLLEILVPSPPPLPRPPPPRPPPLSPVNPNGSSSHDLGPRDAPRRDEEAGKNPHEHTFWDTIQLDRETLLPIPAVALSTAVSRTLGTVATNSSRGQRRNTWSRMTGKIGGGGGNDLGSNMRPLEEESHPQEDPEELRRNKTEEEQRGSSGHAGGSGIEEDCVKDDNEDGHNLPMTRLIAIDSFRFQRSLEWHLPAQKQQQHQQHQPSPPEVAAKRKTTSHSSDWGDEYIYQGRTEDGPRRYPREKDGIVGVDAAEIAAGRVGDEMVETNADEKEEGGEGGSSYPKRYSIGRRQPRLWSQMGIEVRAGHIALTLPPRFQLGDLQVAALLQWKGLQQALGESKKP